MTDGHEDHICQDLERKKDELCQISDFIWDHAEIGFAEFNSMQMLIQALEQENFHVEAGLAGMETAFKGVWGSGHPIVGFLGEYDALAGMNQKSMYTTPEAEIADAPGHGCGHNLLGTGSLGAAVALKDYIAEHNLTGTVVYLGCPAEETGCGKVFMARAGIFDDLDIALTWHPGTSNRVITNSTLANCMMVFRFKGISAHAAAAPHAGRSALDAAELFNVGVQFLREHIPDSSRIHYAFLDVGGQAPNVVQNSAALYYDIRAPKNNMVRELCPRVVRVAEGAALMTETNVSVEVTSAMSDYVANSILSRLMGETMQELGPIPFSPESLRFAEEMSKHFGTEELDRAAQTLNDCFDPDKSKELAQKCLHAEPFPYIEQNSCTPISTDVGDVSYIVPTAQCYVATWAFGTQLHSWQAVAQGKSSIAHEGMIYAAKVMACTAAKIIDDPALLNAIQQEHHQKAGKYICPLSENVEPQIVKS